LDEVEKQILVVIGNEKDQKARLVDLERKVDASKQTISNRVDAMVATGILTDKKGGFPQTRWFSLTAKGYQLLQKIRVVDYVSASEFFTVRQTLKDLLSQKLGEDVRAHKRILDQIDAYCTEQLTPEELHHILQPIIKKIVKAQDKPFQLVVVYSPERNQDQEKIDETG
jgi:DNA-binding MarR family transcriptional regulator